MFISVLLLHQHIFRPFLSSYFYYTRIYQEQKVESIEIRQTLLPLLRKPNKCHFSILHCEELHSSSELDRARIPDSIVPAVTGRTNTENIPRVSHFLCVLPFTQS